MKDFKIPDISGLEGEAKGMLNDIVKQMKDAQDNVKESMKSLEPKFTILPNGRKIQTNTIVDIDSYKKWWWSKIKTKITLNTGIKIIIDCLPTDIKL